MALQVLADSRNPREFLRFWRVLDSATSSRCKPLRLPAAAQFAAPASSWAARLARNRARTVRGGAKPRGRLPQAFITVPLRQTGRLDGLRPPFEDAARSAPRLQ